MVEQTPPPAGGPVDLGILIGLAFQAFTDQLRAALAGQGYDDLGGAYGYVFRVLAEEQPSQRQLAARLGISDQGMAKIVDEMVARGYVERRPDAGDARIKRLRLARRGREALAAARRFHAGFEQRLTRQAGPAAVRGLRRVLAAIARSGGPTGDHTDRRDEDDLAQARLRPM